MSEHDGPRAVLDEIYRALHHLRIPESAFSQCDWSTAAGIEDMARDAFIVGDPRVWWLSVRKPKRVHRYDDCSGFRHLLQHVPAGEERCWFVPDGGPSPRAVFDAEIVCIPGVLGECFFFEYYLVGRAFDWMVAENDHNEIIVSRDLAGGVAAPDFG